jgi:GNAT superfamily N-acetyltransferase
MAVSERIVFRRYLPTDLPSVLELHTLALRVAGAHDDCVSLDEDLARIEKVYFDGGEFLLGMVGERLAAMGALRRNPSGSVEIKRMRVHPDFQRRGFGEAILKQLEHRAAELGYTVLNLDTTVLQVPAQKMYLKNGYSEYRRSRVGKFEVVFFEKRLLDKDRERPQPAI